MSEPLVKLSASDAAGRGIQELLMCCVYAAWKLKRNVGQLRVPAKCWDILVQYSNEPSVRWHKSKTALEIMAGGNWVPVRAAEIGPFGAWHENDCLVEAPMPE